MTFDSSQYILLGLDPEQARRLEVLLARKGISLKDGIEQLVQQICEDPEFQAEIANFFQAQKKEKKAGSSRPSSKKRRRRGK